MLNGIWTESTKNIPAPDLLAIDFQPGIVILKPVVTSVTSVLLQFGGEMVSTEILTPKVAYRAFFCPLVNPAKVKHNRRRL